MDDNVRQIFDMLGVEPNEKFIFKVSEEKYGVFCFSEKLTGYVFDERGERYVLSTNWLLKELLVNPELIFKLPKGPKKKKLRWNR